MKEHQKQLIVIVKNSVKLKRDAATLIVRFVCDN